MRSNLIQQFNDLRTQIDQLAKDAGFNGTNLLHGNKLSVVFNEKTGSEPEQARRPGPDDLGRAISASRRPERRRTAGPTNFQDDTELAPPPARSPTRSASLRSISSPGLQPRVVQARQDFTKT